MISYDSEPDSWDIHVAAMAAVSKPPVQTATTSAKSANTEKADWGDEAPWPTIDKAALYGLLGEIVQALEPHTEGDPMAMLFQILAGFGNALDRGPYIRVGGTRHYSNIFVAVVGATAKARKGQSWHEIKAILEVADNEWLTAALTSGLSTGEGLIGKLADKLDADGKPVIIEKRAMVVEPELSRLFSVSQRKDGTISAIVRDAWDNSTLRVLTRKDPLTASNALVSIIGHITNDELNAVCDPIAIANGFGNRFLFVCAKRSKKLPSGGNLSDDTINDLGRRLGEAMTIARTIREVKRTSAAEIVWARIYDRFPDKPGLAHAIIARGEAQMLRISFLYALSDGKSEINVPHLRAAWAAWKYCEASAHHIFGARLADAKEQKLLDAARDAYPGGLNGEEQDRVTGGRNTKTIRESLAKRKLVRIEQTPREDGGNPSIMLFALLRNAEVADFAEDELFQVPQNPRSAADETIKTEILL